MLPLWDTEKLRRSVPITTMLVTINLVIFVVEIGWLLFQPAGLGSIVDRFALVPARWVGEWRSGEAWWPVGSSLFLHGSVGHVAGNMWFLWVFGRSLEDRIGSFRFLLLYAAGGLGAAVAQVASAPDSIVPMIGASGAISAVLGAFLVLLPGRWIISLVPWIVPILPVPALVFLALWFVAQLINGFGTLHQVDSGGIAWWAHAGGFVTGALLGMAMVGGKTRKSR